MATIPRRALVFVVVLLCALLARAPAYAGGKGGGGGGNGGGNGGGGGASQDSQPVVTEDADTRGGGGAGGGAGGGGAQDSQPVVTEDTDTNDGGTPEDVPDDGDNRHPSGRDRSVEGGTNSGASQSDPDDDGHGPDRSNGGPDQPGGSGGVDLADQDGNNGCGNDDDFEDDNEGLCLGRQRDNADAEVGAAQVTPDHDRETHERIVETDAAQADSTVAADATAIANADATAVADADATAIADAGTTVVSDAAAAAVAEVQQVGEAQVGAVTEVAGVAIERPGSGTGQRSGGGTAVAPASVGRSLPPAGAPAVDADYQIAGAALAAVTPIGSLAYTGSPTVRLALLAAGLLVLGLALLHSARTARASAVRRVD